MLVLTDSGVDLSPEQCEGLEFHTIPLIFTLDGQTYRSGVDIQPDAFYDLLESSKGMPTTSLPSAGEFAELYRELAKIDPEILSIHISSGLSGTFNTAREGAKLVPEARIAFFDTKTLSGAQGWHVEAAARAARAGWSMEQTLALLEQVQAATDTMYTLATLKYLVHGGRISHLKGLVASVLQIKPVIGVEKEQGIYDQWGQARTLDRAIKHIAKLVMEKYPPGTAMRFQILHGNNPEGAEKLHAHLAERFECTWLPIGPIAPVLGAHTGPGLVGLVYAPMAEFPELP